MNPLARVAHFGRFTVRAVRATIRKPPPPGRTLEEAYGIGVRSLPILLIMTFFVGTNLSLQGYDAFAPLGGQQLLGMFVALAGIRELAPIMVGAMIAAKAGTEMASQIAVMRTQEQIDALEVMAIDPHWFLITPRVLGIVLVLPALTVVSIVVMLFAAWLVAVYQLHLPSGPFLQLLAETASVRDLVVCAVKAAVFGTWISTVSCYCGFSSRPGPRGVGEATNVAVVSSAIGCAVLGYLISHLAYS